MTDTDLVHHFARHAATLRYDDMSEPARDAARKSVLDTLGVIQAASGLEPACRAAYQVAIEAGGTPQASLLAYGGKTSAIMAAFANGALVHGLDYDDLTPWGQHCGSSILPAVFAVAERQGGVSGRDLIAGIAVGQDIFARLLRYTGWRKDWNFSTVAGVYAGVAAAGRVMGFDADRMAAAMGIATLQSAGVMEMVAGSGSDLRGLYAGFSAKGAVLSVLMAEQGLGGIERAFEGPNGVMTCYFDGRYDREAMLHGLGQDLMGETTLYKRWPCVGTAHSHMKAALDIVTDHNVALEDIAQITLHVGDYHLLMSEPLPERQAPKTSADAKFSLPFLVSVAMVRGGMSVRDFTAAGLHDPQVLALAQKVDLHPDPALDWNGALPPGRVQITLRDGRSWLREGTRVPGNADNPMTWADLEAKFSECAAVGVRPLTPEHQSRVIQMAQALHELPDATQILEGL